MTEISRPWSGTSVGDAGNYSDQQWKDMFRSLTQPWMNGTNKDYNVVRRFDLPSPVMFSLEPNQFSIVPPLAITETSPVGMSISVNPGGCWVYGHYYYSDDYVVHNVSQNISGNDRIDSLVLTIDWTSQTVRQEYVEGTAAVSPAEPALIQTVGSLYQVRIANVWVLNGALQINESELVNFLETGRTRMINDRYTHVGEVKMVSYDASLQNAVPPTGWVMMDGRSLSKWKYQNLLEYLNGASVPWANRNDTFYIPDMRSRVPVGMWQNQSTDGGLNTLTQYILNETFGTDDHTMTIAEMPAHSHSQRFASSGGALYRVSGLAAGGSSGSYTDSTGTANQGGGDPHENRQPSLALTFIMKT